MLHGCSDNHREVQGFRLCVIRHLRLMVVFAHLGCAGGYGHLPFHTPPHKSRHRHHAPRLVRSHPHRGIHHTHQCRTRADTLAPRLGDRHLHRVRPRQQPHDQAAAVHNQPRPVRCEIPFRHRRRLRLHIGVHHHRCRRHDKRRSLDEQHIQLRHDALLPVVLRQRHARRNRLHQLRPRGHSRHLHGLHSAFHLTHPHALRPSRSLPQTAPQRLPAQECVARSTPSVPHKRLCRHSNSRRQRCNGESPHTATGHSHEVRRTQHALQQPHLSRADICHRLHEKTLRCIFLQRSVSRAGAHGMDVLGGRMDERAVAENQKRRT